MDESEKIIESLKIGGTFFIDGHWNGADKEPFEGYCCAFGEWDGVEDGRDHDIFYYFETHDELRSFMVDDGRDEFTVTRVYK